MHVCCVKEKKDAEESSNRDLFIRNFLVLYEDFNTTKLKRHLKAHHRAVFDELMQDNADNKHGLTRLSSPSSTMDSYVDRFNEFDQIALAWMVGTYQPLSTFDNPSFRKMIQTAVQAGKRGHGDKTKVTTSSMQEQVHQTAANIRSILNIVLANKNVAISLDGWTSAATESYLGATAHFISKDWKLESIGLQCRPTGTEGGTAEDMVTDLNALLVRFNISKEFITAIVTDIEPTMNCLVEWSRKGKSCTG